jgi:hypothetical protein
MEKPIELNDAETAAVSGGILNNIFVNTGEIEKSFNTNSFNFQSFNPSNSNNAWHSFNSWLSNNSL